MEDENIIYTSKEKALKDKKKLYKLGIESPELNRVSLKLNDKTYLISDSVERCESMKQQIVR